MIADTFVYPDACAAATVRSEIREIGPLLHR